MKLVKLYQAHNNLKNDLTDDKLFNRRKKELVDVTTLSMSSIKYKVSIEQDWILEIESKLEYLSKAIAEERQFITSEGDVIPIEKVKHVSVESVKHLARHANLITHVSDEDDEDTSDLTPDKILMVERLTDYAVYENRFLYMLLTYLKEFIHTRFIKINELLSTCKNQMELNTNLDKKKDKFNFTISLDEHRFNNNDFLIDEKSKALLSKIEDIALYVNSLLSTDLMQEVSKKPMLKPPITKTNVLKMDHNFKNAVALYEYISTYEGLGYNYEEVSSSVNDNNKDALDDSLDLDLVSSYLTSFYTGDIKSSLEEEYEKYLHQKQIDEHDSYLKNIEDLKNKLEKQKIDPYEYILDLEKTLDCLKEEHQMLLDSEKKIDSLNNKIESLNNNIEKYKNDIINLNLKIDKKTEEINQLFVEIESKNKIIEELTNELSKIDDKHQEEINQINSAHKKDIENLEYEHQKELYAKELDVKDECQKEISRLENDRQDYFNSCDERVEQARIELETKSLEFDKNLNIIESRMLKQEEDFKNRIETNTQEVILAKSKVLAIEAKYNSKALSEADYTNKEDFEDLELQYKAFSKLFKQQWKKTKKKIRKEYLWSKKENITDESLNKLKEENQEIQNKDENNIE